MSNAICDTPNCYPKPHHHAVVPHDAGPCPICGATAPPATSSAGVFKTVEARAAAAEAEVERLKRQLAEHINCYFGNPLAEKDAEIAHAIVEANDEIAALRKALDDGCWLWDGQTNPHGYGRAYVKGKLVQAHRLVYESLVGPIPKGLELDHLCRVRSCVNPKHLEPVTGWENRKRGMGFAGKNAAKQTCPKGHPYDATHDTKRGLRRKCRECDATQARARYVSKARRHV